MMIEGDLDLWQQANQARDTGNRELSKGLCLRMLQITTSRSRAHWLLSSIALDECDMVTAVQQARQASLHGASLPLHQRVAVTRQLITVGEFEEAWRILEDMRQEAPADGVLVAIGEQLIMLGRHEDALATLRAAHDLGIRHPMLSFLMASASRSLGHFDAAIAAAEETLHLQPDFAHAHWALSQLGGLADAAGRVDRIRDSIASLGGRGDSGSAQIRSGLALLWHALFRELDAMDDRPAAWIALSNGLAIKRSLQPHDREAEDKLFEQLITTYTAEFVRPRSTDTSVTPVFIVGMPRTGTTLVERIVTNHSLVAACGELDELQLLVKRRAGRWSAGFLDVAIAGRLSDANLDGLGDAYLAAVAWRIGEKRYLVDKHQSNFLLAGVILRCLPNARILHVRRDPMDACFSNLKEPFAAHAYSYSSNQRDVANHYQNHDRLARQLQQVAGDRILEVHYEQLIHNQDHQSERILEFSGLPSEPGVSDITRNRAPIASGSSVQVREPVHARNVGAWQRYASHLGDMQAALDS